MDLRENLAKAQKGNVELDHAFFQAIGGKVACSPLIDAKSGVPRFTKSYDLAVASLPEGWKLLSLQLLLGRAVTVVARMVNGVPEQSAAAGATTGPIAICLASLDAHSLKGATDEHRR